MAMAVIAVISLMLTMQAQANILSLFTDDPAAVNQVYNIACGHQTSLLELFNHLKKEAGSDLVPIHGPKDWEM
jgi:UDP-N-acetylglucosamine 4-epimerase